MTPQEHYEHAVKLGLSDVDMLRNADRRAKTLGDRLTDIILGNRLWSIEETAREAEEAKALRAWLVDKILRGVE